jgi:hypothetical protein
LLARYDAISVRENSGLKVLQSLGIEGGIQLPDPTIILSQEDWQDIIAPRLVKRPYVLVYQLNKNEKADRYIETFSKLKGMRLVRISYDYNHFFKAGLLFCCPKVEEFLSLIYYADYILTDSFHGAAFSINFNKKFAVFYPPRFSTRLQSILELTGLNDRVIEFKDLTIPDRTINYERINYILNEERAKADAFLKSTLRANHVTIGDAQ